MRGGRGLREFSAFHASAYPQLAAQTLAITGSAGITRAATETTLARVWRSWPSLRQAPDLLVRARWTAVLIAAERESTAPSLTADAVQASVGELTGANELGDTCADMADTVVVTAMQRLPRVQRRALVLHYMGGVSVVDMAELSGSSAEHIELLLDDGFTALAESLVWSRRDAGSRGPDLRFDLAAEVLADTAARLPERIAAPPSSALLRHATVAHWSVRVMPVALGAACAAVIAAVAQPASPELPMPATIYAEHGGGTVGGPVGGDSGDAAQPDVVPGPSAAAHPGPMVRMRSIALTSLLDAADRGNSSHDGAADASGHAQVRRSQLGSPAVSSAASSAASGGTVDSSAKGQAGPSASGGRPDASKGRPVAASPGRSSVESGSSSPAAGTSASPAASTPSGPATGASVSPAAGTPSGPAAGVSASPAASTPSGPAAGASVSPAAGTPSGPAAGVSIGPAPANLVAGGSIDAVPSGPTAGRLPGLVVTPETSAQAPSPTPIAAPLVGSARATYPPTTVLTTADPPTTDPRPKPHAADPPITYDPPTAVEDKSTPEPGKPTSEERATEKHQADNPAEGGAKAEHSATTSPAADD